MKLGEQGKSRSDKPAASANFDGTLTHAGPSTAIWININSANYILSYYDSNIDSNIDVPWEEHSHHFRQTNVPCALINWYAIVKTLSIIA